MYKIKKTYVNKCTNMYKNQMDLSKREKEVERRVL